jgi:hypothetical protein
MALLSSFVTVSRSSFFLPFLLACVKRKSFHSRRDDLRLGVAHYEQIAPKKAHCSSDLTLLWCCQSMGQLSPSTK